MPAAQHVAVFEIDRPESGPIRGTAVAVLHRDVLDAPTAARRQPGDSWSAPHPSGRGAARGAPAASPSGTKARAPRLAGRRTRPVGQARCLLQPVFPLVEVSQTALRQ